MIGGQEATSPIPRKQRLILSMPRGEHDESRQLIVLAAQTVGNPRPHCGASCLLMTRLHQCDPRIMINGFGMHRSDQGKFVGDRTNMGKKFRNFCPRLSIAFELEAASHAVEWLPHKLSDSLALGQTFRHRFAVHLDKFGFGVKEIEMRGCTRLEEVDHPFSLGCVGGRLEYSVRIGGDLGSGRGRLKNRRWIQQRGKCRCTNPARASIKKMTPG